VIPIQLTKAVVQNGSDVGPFPPLPIHLCALCDLCGSLPHPDPKTFSDWLELEVVRKGQWQSKIGVGIGIGIEKAAQWDSAIQNRVPQPYCCGVDTTRQ
jgi:hypothetical protein